MKPIKFKESNTIFAEDQPEYEPLHVFKDVNGEVVSCWELGFIERIRLLFNGKIWLSLQTFNNPLQPIYLTTKKKELLISE